MSTAYRAPDLLINGQWCAGKHAMTMPIVNPANAQTLDHLHLASSDQIEQALQAAHRGFVIWQKVPAHERCARLERGVAKMRQNLEHIATLLTLEQGKPLAESRAECAMAADLIKWYAEEARRTYGRIVPARLPNSSMQVHKLPIGPVAAFSPWNFPLVLSSRKIGGALAAGCSIILKAAEETPASVAAMVACFHEELPEGALQLLYGVPSEVSEQLITSPLIRKVSFTGSVPVGRQLAQLSARHLKRVTLELGGHAPVIVCADADIDKTVTMMVTHKFRNAGQACLAPTRFYVDRQIEGPFLEAFVAASHRLVLGDGMQSTTQMGPLANARRAAAVRDLIGRSVEAGAKAYQAPVPSAGFFAPVTVLTEVTPDTPVMQEEPFGPVVTIAPFDTLDHALQLANNSPYGLAGYLFTDSARSIHQVTQGLEVGSLAINGIGVSVPEAPFGGVKDSGHGSESGTEGMEAFLETKFVHLCV
ncbi:MAG: NAD-dependent succinate-semialdehyde dehydrogenase [Hylemonella sp.]|nr:NAD-dependent succinate-semialdehyde dehydrogenase [Hylemonella sp.]